MLGFIVFYSMWFNLGNNCRNKILGNIFDINSVSVSDVKFVDQILIFKMFSCGVFYHYSFILGIGINEIKDCGRIVEKIIFIDDKECQVDNEFIYRLVRCFDEYQVYQLLKEFLW